MKPELPEPTDQARRCEGCNAREGAIHPIYSAIVKLTRFQTRNLCQRCLARAEIKAYQREAKKNLKSGRMQTIQQYIKKFATKAHYVWILGLLLVAEVAIAQGPPLPGDPDQVPLDGGLSLLAAGGGAYALKKLRDKRAE